MSAGLLLATVATVGAGGAVAWNLRGPDAEPTQAAIGQTVGVAGLDLTVEEFNRRRDAVAGSNAKKLPLSGPAMPMNSMGSVGADQGDKAGGMGSMPGMAGMLHDGQERVDVSLVVHNASDEARNVDVADFVLLSEGRPVELLQETVSDITRAEMPAGSTLAGTITFVIPDGTAPLDLRYGDEPVKVVLDASTAPAPADDASGQQPAGGHGGGHG